MKFEFNITRKHLYILLALILITPVFAAVVSHTAEQLRAGVFGQVYSGNWSFMNGSVGIGTESPGAKLTIANGSTLAIGTIGSTPVSGAGTRLMWIPAKAAFRAGVITSAMEGGSRWDEVNIGIQSVAMGWNPKASGISSISLGENTVASATNAVAIGFSTTASEFASTAIGRSTTASGQHATAMGYLTTASGDNSTAIGQAITVSGANSLGIGLNSTPYTISGDNIMAIMGGNVGIGTSSPSHELNVIGDANITGTVYADNFSGNSPIIFINSSGEESVRIEDNGSITATSFVGDGSQLTGISGIPSGVIVMWSGTYNNIPSGWHLCDGTSGTPDLRNRFVYGVNADYGAGNDGDLNTTGGSSTHTHTLQNTEVFFGPTSGDFSYLDDDGGRRTTYYPTGRRIQVAFSSSQAARFDSVITTESLSFPYLQLDPDVRAATSTNLPPYYKLAYIMKL